MAQPIAVRLADLTLELCRMPAVTGQEKAIADQLEPACRARYGCEVRRIGNSLVAGHFDDPRPTLLLAGHLDTVPLHPGDPPASIDGERVVGLGSSDMKGGVAVMLALAEELELARLPVNLALVLYDREEGPFDQNGLGLVLSQVPQLRQCALAMCLESTDNEVQVGCLGSLHARVTFRGRSAHSARPWQGENAIHKAAPLLGELAATGRVRVEVNGFEFFEVVSATQASGGRARNVVPETFEVGSTLESAPRV